MLVFTSAIVSVGTSIVFLPITPMIANYKKLFSIGEELVKSAYIDTCRKPLGSDARKKMDCTPVSNDSLASGVDIISNNSKGQLLRALKQNQRSFPKLDKSMDSSNGNALARFILHLHKIDLCE